MKIYTVGYEGSDIEDFVAFLKRKKIRLVVDVRKNPVSRKKGFSKNKMAENLALKKIDYLSIKNLGVPTQWRKLAKEEVITRKRMFADYQKIILPKAQQELHDLLELSKKSRVAILCYEADPSDCHRSFVAREMKKMSRGKLEIFDLKMAS